MIEIDKVNFKDKDKKLVKILSDKILEQFDGGIADEDGEVLRESFDFQIDDAFSQPTNDGGMIQLDFTFTGYFSCYDAKRCADWNIDFKDAILHVDGCDEPEWSYNGETSLDFEDEIINYLNNLK